MTRILVISAGASGTHADPSIRGLADAASHRGHQLAVLAVGHGPRGRRASADPGPSGATVHRIRATPLLRSFPSWGDARLRAALPAQLRRTGMQRPDVVIATALDESVVAARALSVRYDIPYVVRLLGKMEQAASAADRFEQLLAQSLQEASAVAASTPELAEELRRRFTLPQVHVLTPPAGGHHDEALIKLCEHQVQEPPTAGRMVFHTPYPLDPSPVSASRQRPNKMLSAFIQNGHRVHRITGLPFQRGVAFRDLRARVRAGQKITFLYSENSTQPNVLATSLRAGFAPLLEARILAFCARRRIPAGQFYRDAYWRFAEKQRHVPPVRKVVMKVAYRADLLALRFTGAHLFLPSLDMAPIVPFRLRRCTALPPGAPVHESSTPLAPHYLYVGGVGPGHEVDECLKAFKDVRTARLTMVVPRDQWAEHRQLYDGLLTERVRVVHAGSEELRELYDEASACLLLVAPNVYRTFAVPLKLYEYLGYGKPTLASSGTLAGELVQQMGIGFTTPNKRTDIAELLLQLERDPALLARAAARSREVRHEHTWSRRARTVADVLSGPGNA